MWMSTGLPIQDLRRWGFATDGENVESIREAILTWDRKIPSFAEAQEYCRSLARRHYENFSVATFFLPRALRSHFYALYAYCRWADDLGDEIADDTLSLLLLDWWEKELHALYAGEKPTHPVFIALAETVQEFGIPETLFLDLLTAFRQDRTVREYATRTELLEYCRCSANPVGRLILYLARVTDEAAFYESDAICTGLQLANFWQDVARDWRQKGRIYLPREDRERFSYTDADFQTFSSIPEFRALLAEEVRWAESFFEAGRPLINRIPRAFQLEIRLFHDGGMAILDAIRKQNYTVWENRPEVGRWTKIRLIIKAFFSYLSVRNGVAGRPSLL